MLTFKTIGEQPEKLWYSGVRELINFQGSNSKYTSKD